MIFHRIIRFLFFILLLISNTLSAEKVTEIEDFANKYIKIMEDKLNTKNYKVVLDVKDSEVSIDKKYGKLIYRFNEYYIESGEIIVEKSFNKINFQLINHNDSPSVNISYKIKFK